MGIKADISRDQKESEGQRFAKSQTAMGCLSCKPALVKHLLKRACCTCPRAISLDKDGKCDRRVER